MRVVRGFLRSPGRVMVRTHGARYACPWSALRGPMEAHRRAYARAYPHPRASWDPSMGMPTPAYDASIEHVCAFPWLRTMPRSSTYVPSHGCVRCLVGPRTCLRGAAYDLRWSTYVPAWCRVRCFVGPRMCLRSAAYELRGST